LVALVARAGTLVPRDDLRRAVWSDETHVDYDGGLNYCVRQLRVALGDEARRPRFIETVARQGYRFLTPVARGRQMRSARRRTWIVSGGAALAALAFTLLIETGGRSEGHHRTAMAVARAVHDFVF
jgi:DNA-binding winged helix-turn-helix (wHTH) protein